MIGKTISHYKILEKIGQGGMGIVYKAQDLKLKRPVALKFLPEELTSDPKAKERFIQEAQAASALDHPNICTVHEIDETEDGQMFMVMTCYQGETLDQKIQRGALRLEKAVEIAVAVARGLAKAHSHEMVHRDVKPANIFITDDGRVKIFDFGLAKLKDQKALDDRDIVAGTAAYMSPEQVRGEEVDARSDIWSLGVAMYEMIAGQKPFTGDYLQALEYSILNEDPQPLRNLRPGVPVELERAVNRALAKDRNVRYQNLEDMLTDLVDAQETLESPARTARPIAVITFENQTGDKTYDYLQRAIPNLLITSLERSQNLRVVTWERLRDLLKQLGKEDVDVIDRDLGFQLCRMESIDHIVLGSFTRAGDVFATDVKILDVKTKELLHSASSKGQGVNSILENQIDDLNREISKSLGIGEEEPEESRQSIVDVTTSSMEAYRYFLRGRDSYERLYNDDARRYLEKATELDPDFAVAHLYLAWIYDRLRDLDRRNESFEKAKALADRATKRERLYIEAAYARTIEQDQDKRYQLLRQTAREYPREKLAHHHLASYYRGKRQFYQAVEEYKKVLELDPNYGWALNELAYMYTDIEEFEQAAEYFQRYATISPGDANPIDSMGELCFRMGELDEALEKYKETLAVKPDFYYAYWEIAYIYALKENYAQTLRWIDEYIDHAPSLGTRAEGYRWKSFYQCWGGNWKMALEESDRLTGLARERGSEFWNTEAERIRGWIYYDKGENELSRRCFQHCAETIQSNPKEYIPPTTSYSPDAKEQLEQLEASYSFALALLDLKAKDIDAARSRLTKIQSLLPNYSALLHAEILLAEESPEKAITICEKAPLWQIPYMSDLGGMFSYNLPFMKDVLARAYQSKGRNDRAIAAYERLIIFQPDSRDRRLIHPMYRYRVAKLYQEQGRLKQAVEQYERSLEIWKDADPVLVQAEDVRERLKELKRKLKIGN